jgi:uncharacterized protein YjiS (DUF1127 family)
MLTRILNYLIKVQERRAAYWQLQTFSDKQLKDIGLSRGEIYEAVYGEDDNKNEVKGERGWKLYKARNAQAPV